jgi:cytochrome c peroxidase
MNRLFLLGVVILSVVSCRERDIVPKQAITFPQDFPPYHYNNPNNTLSKEKISLGQQLFYDKNLSSNRTISCGSCHAQVHGFADHNIPISFGIFNRKGIRNTPGLVNLAWMNRFMWDGGIRHLDVLPIAPFTDSNEMGLTLNEVVNRVNENSKYTSLMQAAFGESHANETHILLALSQFMLSLISDNSKYDRVRRKQEHFTAQENKGYQLFRKYCADCHSEPLLTNNQLSSNGITTSGSDLGHFIISQMPSDSFLYKVPTLRNIELTYPYMHNGTLHSLGEVIDAYNRSDRNKAPQLKKIFISSEEKEHLIAFLKTLTDYTFISNHQFSEPK